MLSISWATSLARAQDWPQILGPNRDGNVIEQRLQTELPNAPNLRWQVALGSGFGGAAIVNDNVFVMHRLGSREILQSIDLASGKKQWQCDWPATYRASYNPDNGPRCVPTVASGKAVCYGAAGELVSVDTSDGSLVWQRSLRSEYGAEDGYFGAGSSPLVVDDLIVLCLGGKKAGIVGIDLSNGKTRWTSTAYDASYASPIAVDAKTALVVTRLRTVLIELSNGQVLDEIAFGSRGPTVNAATPIAVGTKQFLLTASYGVGATLLQIENDKLVEVFSGSDLLSSQYNTPVSIRSSELQRIVGINGREDVGVASLRAVDLENRKLIWDEQNFGTAHLFGFGSQVLALSIDGQLALLDASKDELVKLGSLKLPQGVYRAPPAFSNGGLVVRSTDERTGLSQLMCIDLPLQTVEQTTQP